jgi:magnesium and cobalt transporter
MPDGDGSIRKQGNEAPNILQKLFSFFQFKKHHLYSNQRKGSVLDNNTSDWMDYQKLKAEDIMIPRIDIVAVNFNSSLSEISKVFLTSRHTRMPVFKESFDNIIGYINIKDILPHLLNPDETIKFDINKVIRNLLIVSPSMKIFDLLEKMRQTRTHIALVVDEFGGADGLITIEDLVEELIGKIDDEYDIEIEEFKDLGNSRFEVSGRLEIGVLEEKFEMQLNNGDEYDTVGGLILSISGHVPEKGSIITHQPSGLVFEIIDSDPRRIKKVLISLG